MRVWLTIILFVSLVSITEAKTIELSLPTGSVKTNTLTTIALTNITYECTCFAQGVHIATNQNEEFGETYNLIGVDSYFIRLLSDNFFFRSGFGISIFDGLTENQRTNWDFHTSLVLGIKLDDLIFSFGFNHFSNAEKLIEWLDNQEILKLHDQWPPNTALDAVSINLVYTF